MKENINNDLNINEYSLCGASVEYKENDEKDEQDFIIDLYISAIGLGGKETTNANLSLDVSQLLNGFGIGKEQLNHAIRNAAKKIVKKQIIDAAKDQEIIDEAVEEVEEGANNISSDESPKNSNNGANKKGVVFLVKNKNISVLSETLPLESNDGFLKLEDHEMEVQIKWSTKNNLNTKEQIEKGTDKSIGSDESQKANIGNNDSIHQK